MKILFVAAEATPLVKVGGMADVVGSLPLFLKELGHDVRVALPKYAIIDATKYPATPLLSDVPVTFMETSDRATVERAELGNGLRFYLIGNQRFFGTSEIYSGDELGRFFFFCRAVAEVVHRLDWQPEIVHCHDWHTGLIPFWLRAGKHPYTTVFTIHNLAYQGSFGDDFMVRSGLANEMSTFSNDMLKPLRHFLGFGIVCSDVITTVSEAYAREILTPEYGAGLDYLMRSYQQKLFGILNGLDYHEFNPATDPFIPRRYDRAAIELRVANKRVLQQHFGLAVTPELPLIGMVSRLDDQKGIDLLLIGLDAILSNRQVQMVIVGKGRDHYQRLLQEASQRYAGRLAVSTRFDEYLARLVYAGCDIFLMPSRYEPCGLGQLIAMRYGAVPVARYTGGLVDTVDNLTSDLSQGDGFVFNEYSVEAMAAAVTRAAESYQHKEAWNQVLRRIMTKDFSWHASGRKYEDVYRKARELHGRT